MEYSLEYSFVYVFCVAFFVLQWQSWVTATKTVRSTKPKIFIIWFFIEKNQPLISIGSPSCGGALSFFCKTTSLRYSLYHIIHPFKVYNSLVLVYSQPRSTITTINFRAFSLPQKETLYPIAATLNFPQPPQA